MTKKFKFLPETPSKTDALAGGHSRVAESIKEFILGIDHGIRMVALEGEMGSGKSTIISLLRTQLGKNSKIFVFDCFEHQHGPLRNAFLQELSVFVKSQLVRKQNSKKEIEEALLEATGRARTSKITNNTRVSLTALLLLISTPVALGASGAFFRLIGVGPNWAVILCAIAMLMPALIVLASFIVNHRDPKWHLSRILTSNNENEVYESHSLGSEITSTDIARCYEKIVGKLEAESSLVIVFDNLDRMEAESLLAFWADLEIFASCVKPNIWIVVPFAKTHLSSAFNMASGMSDQPHRAEEFISKRFPVSYQVPKLLLSNWKEYFASCWKMVFEAEYDEAVVSDVIQLFGRYGPSGKQPTPRQIKQFINSIAASLSVAVESPDPRVVAAVNLFSIENEASLVNFLGRFGDQEQRYAASIMESCSDDWQQDVAALYFGVDRETGREVLLYDPITDAIRTANTEAFKELAELKPALDIFSEVLELRTSPTDLASTALCLSALEEDKLAEGYLDYFRNALRSIDSWELLEDPYTYVSAIERLFGDSCEAILSKQWSALVSEFPTIDDSNQSRSKLLAANLDAMRPSVRVSLRKEGPEIAPEYILRDWWNSKIELSIDVFESITKSNSDRLHFVSAYLNEGGNIDVDGLLRLRGLFPRSQSAAFAKTLTANYPTQLERNMAGRKFELADSVAAIMGKFENPVNTYNGALGDPQMGFIEESERAKTRTAVLVGALTHCKATDIPESFKQHLDLYEHDEEWIRRIFIAEKSGRCAYRLLFEAHRRFGHAVTSRLVLESIANGWFSILSIEYFLRNYSDIRSLFEESEDFGIIDFVKFCHSWLEHIVQKIPDAVKLEELPLQFFEDALATDSDYHVALLDILQAHLLESRTTEDWLGLVFETPASLTAGLEVIEEVELGSEVAEALYEASSKLASGEEPEEPRVLEMLFSHLSTSNQKRFEKRLRQLIYSTAKNDHALDEIEVLLSYWGQFLKEYVPADQGEAEGLEVVIRLAASNLSDYPSLEKWLVKMGENITKIRP